MLIFDIETGPLTLDEILAVSPPFVAPPHPGEFKPEAVKLGNTKDPAKVREKIEAARQSHERAVAEYEADVRAARKAFHAEKLSRAALDPTTGRVVAIGYYSVEKQKHHIDHGDEAKVLATFWTQYVAMRKNARKIVGANIFGFDLPFLIRRSWMLHVDVPSTVRDGRYWDRIFVDIRETWLLGQRWGDCQSSLDVMARALGAGAKPDGVDGGHFWELWTGGEEKRQEAIAYLVNDLNMTWGVAQRIGVV